MSELATESTLKAFTLTQPLFEIVINLFASFYIFIYIICITIIT